MLNNIKETTNMNKNNKTSDDYHELKNMVNELIKINNELYEKNNILINKNEILLKELSKNNHVKILENQFNEYKKNTNEILDSYNNQFNTLFIDCDLKIKGMLKYNQMLNQELLDFVVNICNKYGLEYWLSFGNLIGAVRHGGFIPWDDDTDIGMMRKDYNILVKVIYDEVKNNNLNDVIGIYIDLGPHKPWPVLQLLYNGGIGGSIFAGIDVFVYDYTDEFTDSTPTKYFEVQKSVFDNNRNGMALEFALKEYYEKFNINLDSGTYIIDGIENLYSLARVKPYDPNKIFPLKPIKFENKIYTAPNDIDYYLTQVYGNYLNIPKIVYHHHQRFDSLKRKEDGIEFYKQQIMKLKKVNEKILNEI